MHLYLILLILTAIGIDHYLGRVDRAKKFLLNFG